MAATLQRIVLPSLICRAGPDHRELGDPYCFACVVGEAGGVAHISAGCGVIDAAVRVSIHEALTALGFAGYEYERHKDGRVYAVRRRAHATVLD